MTSRVLAVLAHDHWAAVEADTEFGPALLRFRTPVIESDQSGEHAHLLQVVWGYAAEGSGEMPSADDSEDMACFEDRLCEAWECDGLAFLAAVLTFDGARQWIFYTHDVGTCGDRLNEIPHDAEPYPIELTTREDPTWSYLRDSLLVGFDWQANQPEWNAALDARRS